MDAENGDDNTDEVNRDGRYGDSLFGLYETLDKYNKFRTCNMMQY